MVEPSKDLQLVFDKAIKDAQKLKHEYVTVEHLLFAMMCESKFDKLLQGYGADVDYVKGNLRHFLKANTDLVVDIDKFKPKKTQTVERILNRAFTQVLFSGRNSIQLQDVLSSILTEKKTQACYFLNKGGIEKDSFNEYVSNEV